jgi:hypothetical protein
MTYTENGWHPHVHELVFMGVKMSPGACENLKNWLVERWVDCLRKEDYDASYEHGIDVRTADSKIADYIAKWGREPREMSWNIEHEITNAPRKTARRSGLTPFELLEAYDIGDKRAEGLFLEYADAVSTRQQLVWSKGLRALLKLPEEITDQLLPGFEEEPTTYTALEIDQKSWNRVMLHDLRGALLWLVAKGDWATLRALLRKYDIRADIHDAPPPQSVGAALINTPPGSVSDNYSPQRLFDLPVKQRSQYDDRA